MRLLFALLAATLIATLAMPAYAQSVQPVRGAVKGTGQVAAGAAVGTAQVAKGAAKGTATAARGTARGFRCIFTLGARC